MNVKGILATLGVAAATMAFTLVLFAPVRVGAIDNPQGIKPMIARPKLTVNGCVFTLKTDRPAYQPGETPVVQIEATNPTTEPVETTVWVNMSAVSLFSRVSRSLTSPAMQILWSDEWAVGLKPGETKSIALATEVALPAGQLVSITISDQQQAVIANLLSMPNGVLTQSANRTLPAVQAIPATPEK